MKIERSSPGKIFLSGEYLALDGNAAILMSVKQRAKVSIEDYGTKNNIFYCSNINQEFPFSVDDNYQTQWLHNDPNDYGSFLSLALKIIKIKLNKALILIDTNDLYSEGFKIGLGSSSAISVAIVNAINDFCHLKLSPAKIIHYSLKLHQMHQQKKGSGLDVLSSFADSDLIECDSSMLNRAKWNTFKWPSNLYIKGVLTSNESSTPCMIKKYNLVREENNLSFQNLHSKITHNLSRLSEQWAIGNTSEILIQFNAYNLLMKQLDKEFNVGIYTEDHNNIASLAKKFNLLYKPSGAGGGDLGFVLSDDMYKMQKFNKLLSGMYYKTIELR
jgi:phosphomevalonate kinase